MVRLNSWVLFWCCDSFMLLMMFVYWLVLLSCRVQLCWCDSLMKLQVCSRVQLNLRNDSECLWFRCCLMVLKVSRWLIEKCWLIWLRNFRQLMLFSYLVLFIRLLLCSLMQCEKIWVMLLILVWICVLVRIGWFELWKFGLLIWVVVLLISSNGWCLVFCSQCISIRFCRWLMCRLLVVVLKFRQVVVGLVVRCVVRLLWLVYWWMKLCFLSRVIRFC